MKTLLVALNSKFVHTNLALRYLYHTIKDDFDAVLKEFTINEEIFKLLGGILEEKPDIIAFGCYIWNIGYIIKLCQAIKQINPEIKIILGGPEVSYDPKEILDTYDFVDFIIIGEGEESFPKLINQIVNNVGCLEDIDGSFGIVHELSKIPSPFMGDLSEYKQKVAYFESSRGCPYNCSYCLSSTTKGIRYFPMERTLDELGRLINAGAMQVKFVDRTFNADKKRAMQIWNFLLKNKKETTFHFEISAHLLDDEMINFLAKVPKGYFQFEIGVQSTYAQAIEAIDRKTDFQKLSYVIRRLKEAGNIQLHLDLIAGLPYETYLQFKKTFDDVYKLDPDVLQLGFLKFLKGSKIRNEQDLHGYKFIQDPPYEVLENYYIKFEEIIKLKRIEEVLEVYKNKGRFEKTLEYLMRNFYQSSFDFFEELAIFWLKSGYFNRNISGEFSYDILADFYIDKQFANAQFFFEILAFDYLKNNFNTGKRPWIKF
jgi:radical SAM superfamily enzyme YgiQ (UPF0313 family)